MDVINSAIQITQDNSDDVRGTTIFESFTSFNQHLFWISQQKRYQTALHKGERNVGSQLMIGSKA